MKNLGYFLGIAALSCLAGPLQTVAQTTFTWDGGGANNNVNTTLNWVSDTYAANVANTYVFSDGSVRNTVTINSSPQGVLQFGGDSFSLNFTSFLDSSPTGSNSIILDSNNLITFSGASGIQIRKGITGTGTGVIAISNNLQFTSNNYSWNSNGAVIINDADGTNVIGDNRTFTLGGQQKVIVNNASGAGIGQMGVIVGSGTVLGGNGFLTPGSGTTSQNINVQSGGFLSPGDNYSAAADAGTLSVTFGNSAGVLNLNSGSKFNFDLATVGSSDRVFLTNGSLTLAGQQFNDFSFTALSGFGAGTYTLFDTSGLGGSLTGSLGASLSGTIAGYDSTLSILNNDVILTVLPIPEPGSVELLALAVSCLFFSRRAKRR